MHNKPIRKYVNQIGSTVIIQAYLGSSVLIKGRVVHKVRSQRVKRGLDNERTNINVKSSQFKQHLNTTYKTVKFTFTSTLTKSE